MLIYLLFFVLLSVILLIVNYKKIPKAAQEEELWSREFWMFLGSLVLLMACIQIVVTTSLPVSSKIAGYLHDVLPFFKDTFEKISKQAPPVDRIGFYNRWQIPFAIIVTLLVAIGLYFKFKTTDMKQFIKQLLPPFITSIVFTVAGAIFLKLTNGFFIALLFTCWFAVMANFHYWVQNKKANFLKGGATFAHLGFGLIIMGALISLLPSRLFR